MLVRLNEYAKINNVSINTLYSQITRKQLKPTQRIKHRIYMESTIPYKPIERNTNYKHAQYKDVLELYPDYFQGNSVSHTRLYNTWDAMKNRCSNPNHKNYKQYGGKGIKVCDEWNNSFSKFCIWAMNNGYKENLTIDRIDSDLDYCPENCRWITKSENSKHKKNRVRQ